MLKGSQQALALVDCNIFYVSCERIFRPDLARAKMHPKSKGVFNYNALTLFAANARIKLRAQRSHASVIQLFLGSHRF